MNIDISIEDYDYDLPHSRIASYPLLERDQCNLLLSDARGGLSDHIFSELPRLLPDRALLVRNNTQVIKARMFFPKDTGATIEVLCLEPLIPSDYALSLSSTKECTWRCMVGNSKRWHAGQTLSSIIFIKEDRKITLQVQRDHQSLGNITFSWDDDRVTFGEILEYLGQLPIPPYLNRPTEESDLVDYQTLYAKIQGSVAAPTAGLHFTQQLDKRLQDEGVDIIELTLHVGAGTFLPVKTSQVSEHVMHSEYCVVPLSTLEMLKAQLDRPIVAVGTTSVRTLESLYWLSVALGEGRLNTTYGAPLHLDQWYCYDAFRSQPRLSRQDALEMLISYLRSAQLKEIVFTTSLLIVPGYTYQMVDALVTNFHQPKSTLLLLVAAFVGDWRSIYQHALSQPSYRFLSYGDACLLYPRVADGQLPQD